MRAQLWQLLPNEGKQEEEDGPVPKESEFPSFYAPHVEVAGGGQWTLPYSCAGVESDLFVNGIGVIIKRIIIQLISIRPAAAAPPYQSY